MNLNGLKEYKMRKGCYTLKSVKAGKSGNTIQRQTWDTFQEKEKNGLQSGVMDPQGQSSTTSSPGLETKRGLPSQISIILETSDSFFLPFSQVLIGNIYPIPFSPQYFRSRQLVFQFFRFTSKKEFCSRMNSIQNLTQTQFR